MLSNQSPIGIFDSGVGGISVLKHIRTLLPNEDLIYVADSKYAPYGSKTPEEIQARCVAITNFLISKHIKTLVVACNTATAAAIETLRARYSIPIIGMEPAVKPAALASKKGIVGILATTGTLKSAQFAALLESYGRNVQVMTQACVGLVECIERGEVEEASTKALLQKYLTPLLTEGADAIVLGCTHYPFVKPLIQDIVGKNVALIDTGDAVAKQLQRQLNLHHLCAPEHRIGNVTIWTNSPAENANEVINRLWGSTVNTHQLE